MKKKSSQQKISTENEELDIGDPYLDFSMATDEELIREAFKLFCVPSNSNKKNAEEALSDKREEFISNASRTLDMNCCFDDSHEAVSLKEELLLLLLQVLYERSVREVSTALSQQEKVQLFYPFNEDSTELLKSQREIIKQYLTAKAARSFGLSDGRKKMPAIQASAGSSATFDHILVSLFILCYRLAPKLTMSSPAVMFIGLEHDAFQADWKRRLLEERKREKKVIKRNVHPGEGHVLTYLETWLFKHWADPRLPLCALSLQDIKKAADFSPELPPLPVTNTEPKPGRATPGAIRQVINRAGLTRMDVPLAINVQELKLSWPPFDYDINPELDPPHYRHYTVAANAEMEANRLRLKF